ncbi:MAG: Lpg1974 family pore-forming outer membrane protein, partial [Caulobacteraceae bacterium]
YAHFDASTRGTFSTSSKYFSTSGSFSVGRRTNVVGPRIWIRSAIPLGASNFSVGWGGGAAVLFGSENVTEDAAYADGSTPFHAYRSNSATVPNVDGYLKLNFHEPNSPVTISAGYRVDAYFNAMDGGWDTERKVDIIEHGPFLEMIWKIQ